MDCSTTVIVIILIVVAILLYFNLTGKDTSIFGGHKVVYDKETLHIHKFKELKDKLRALSPIWTNKQIHNSAELIVSEFLKSMNGELKSDKQTAAEHIDNLIVAYIDSDDLQTFIVNEQTSTDNQQTSTDNQQTRLINNLHEFINSWQKSNNS